MRTIGVVTVGRSDFGIYRPILRKIVATAGLRLRLFVGGAHLSPRHGNTIDEVVAEGYSADHRIAAPEFDDSPAGIAAAMGANVAGFAAAYAQDRPDILLVLGDRHEMFAAATAAIPFGVPLAHVHGGEVTRGAIDEAFRHSLTKFAHLHFAATEEAAERIRQMGEEPWRVVVSGAPSLDNLRNIHLLPWPELAAQWKLPNDRRPILVTFHPETLRYAQTGDQSDELLAALATVDRPLVFTAPNADTGATLIRERIAAFAAVRPEVRVVENLGTRNYFSLMSCAAAMVGNSSSGLIEAASLKLPVVNVGLRQAGRLAPDNVMSVELRRDEITAALGRVLARSFRERLATLHNPYGDGQAAERIVAVLKSTTIDEALILKKFCDRDGATIARRFPPALAS